MDSRLTRRELLGAVAATAATAATVDGVGAQEQLAGEWPTFGYDRAKSGHNPDGTGPREDVGGAWQYTEPGEITAGPVVADGVAYAASTDGNLYAVDAITGDGIDDWPVELGASSEATPTVADGTVYVGDESGTIWAFDAQSGETEWRFETDGPVGGAPVVHDGIVYATSEDGVVYAIDGATGAETEWTFETGGGEDAEIRGGPALVPDGEGATVYVANTGGIVYALDADSGTEQWREVVDRGQVQAAPAVADSTVYVSAVEGTSGFVYALDAETGTQQWDFEADGPVVSSPAATAEHVYIGSRSQHVYAIEATLGEEQWRVDTGRQVNAAPVVVDETVYAVSFSNELFGLTTDGDQRFSAETVGSVSAAPAVADGRVFVASESGGIYALESGGEVVLGPGEDDGDDEQTDSPLAGTDSGPFDFLILPAAVFTFFSLFAAGIYAILRSDWADQFAVDEPPVEKLYEDDEQIPDFDDRSETEVWSMIVEDVIARAADEQTVATENVIVTKHIDDALEAPVTAYRIESARDSRARLTLTEPLFGEGAGELDGQPLNEGWTVGEEELTFETTLDPGETAKTMIGRHDTDDIDGLLDKPDVTIEPLGGNADTKENQ